MLVFLNTNFKKDAEDESISLHNYYFLGIYNFNLGRKSYFNLGYKDLNILTDDMTLKNGFNLYEVNKERNVLLPGIRVAEVQGNSPYFDFS